MLLARTGSTVSLARGRLASVPATASLSPHTPPPAPKINPSKDLEMEGKEFTHGDVSIFPLLSKDTVHLLPPFVFPHWDLPAAERPRR